MSRLRRSIANVYQELGELRKAEQEYQKAIQMDPEDPNSNYFLAVLLTRIIHHPSAAKADLLESAA